MLATHLYIHAVVIAGLSVGWAGVSSSCLVFLLRLICVLCLKWLKKETHFFLVRDSAHSLFYVFFQNHSGIPAVGECPVGVRAKYLCVLPKSCLL